MRKPTPTELREGLCEDLADLQRDAGKLPDNREIEKQVDQDIAYWAARRREAKPVKKEKVILDPNGNPAKKIAQEKGLRMDVRPYDDTDDVRLNTFLANLDPISRLYRIRMRLELLCSKRNGEFVYPKFANEFIREYFNLKMYRREYKNLSEVDRSRRFWTKVQDLCDRSTLEIIGLGPWR